MTQDIALDTRLPFTENAKKILMKRYLRQGPLTSDPNGPYGHIETPEQMYDRIAKALALVEKQYGASDEDIIQMKNTFYDILSNFEFTPAGRTITNAGAETPVVANCIVLHPGDSMDGIFSTLKDAAQLQQLGSGLGFPWHVLRPAGWRAKRSGGVASGPVSFLKVYDRAFGVIKQQGRHGANMGVMKVSHPDILEFIRCKNNEGEIKNFNISVGFTDEFMQRVIANDESPYLCEFNGVKMKPRIIKRDKYDTIITIEEVDMSAPKIFHEIVESAWINGEPGCLFLDEANRTNPVPGDGPIEATNPCGEQFLGDGDVCNLGSINLDRFVKEGKIDWERLEHVTQHSVRMLDNVIDLFKYPVERVEKTSKKNRRLGLGIMGWADMLYQLKIPYNSQEAIDLAEKVMGRIQYVAERTSEYAAIEKGNFPNIEKSIFNGKHRRNAALTCVAPTGSISMLFDTTSGIEPTFALTYFKGQVMGGNVLYYTNKHFEKELKERGLYSEELMKKIAEKGSIQHLEEIPEDMRRVYVVSHDITPDNHIKMQAAFQRIVDNAISKTINFPHDASIEDIKKSYIDAWQMKLKGMTVYRDGSREVEVLSVKDPTKKEAEIPLPIPVAVTETCPSCSSQLRIEEGCANCPQCGLSMCKI